MDSALIIGYLASICSVTSFVPQAWKVIKTGDTTALSARMYALTVTGFALWTAFGILRTEGPIILTNSLCFLFSGFILYRKLWGGTPRTTPIERPLPHEFARRK